MALTDVDLTEPVGSAHARSRLEHVDHEEEEDLLVFLGKVDRLDSCNRVS